MDTVPSIISNIESEFRCQNCLELGVFTCTLSCGHGYCHACFVDRCSEQDGVKGVSKRRSKHPSGFQCNICSVYQSIYSINEYEPQFPLRDILQALVAFKGDYLGSSIPCDIDLSSVVIEKTDVLAGELINSADCNTEDKADIIKNHPRKRMKPCPQKSINASGTTILSDYRLNRLNPLQTDSPSPFEMNAFVPRGDIVVQDGGESNAMKIDKIGDVLDPNPLPVVCSVILSSCQNNECEGNDEMELNEKTEIYARVDQTALKYSPTDQVLNIEDDDSTAYSGSPTPDRKMPLERLGVPDDDTAISSPKGRNNFTSAMYIMNSQFTYLSPLQDTENDDEDTNFVEAFDNTGGGNAVHVDLADDDTRLSSNELMPPIRSTIAEALVEETSNASNVANTSTRTFTQSNITSGDAYGTSWGLALHQDMTSLKKLLKAQETHVSYCLSAETIPFSPCKAKMDAAPLINPSALCEVVAPGITASNFDAVGCSASSQLTIHESIPVDSESQSFHSMLNVCFTNLSYGSKLNLKTCVDNDWINVIDIYGCKDIWEELFVEHIINRINQPTLSALESSTSGIQLFGTRIQLMVMDCDIEPRKTLLYLLGLSSRIKMINSTWLSDSIDCGYLISPYEECGYDVLKTENITPMPRDSYGRSNKLVGFVFQLQLEKNTSHTPSSSDEIHNLSHLVKIEFIVLLIWLNGGVFMRETYQRVIVPIIASALVDRQITASWNLLEDLLSVENVNNSKDAVMNMSLRISNEGNCDFNEDLQSLYNLINS